MFRSTKKKTRKSFRTSARRTNSDDSDDDYEIPIANMRGKKKSKLRSKTAIRSFNADELEVPLGEKSKKRGLGFGGMGAAHVHSTSDVALEPIGDKYLETDKPSYGKEALDTLRAEQQRRKPTKTEQNAQETEVTNRKPSDVTVLSGEEATNLIDETGPTFKHPEKQSDSEYVDSDPGHALAEEVSTWEDQLAMRAGVSVANPSSAASSSPIGNLPGLRALRSQLQFTAANISARNNDVENAARRREADLTQLEYDLKRHQATLKDVGMSCDYYQKLRHDLALWVGALRDLQQKVDPIYDAVIELIIQQHQKNHKEWIDWQDDAVVVLQQASMLSSTAGRQPQILSQIETGASVDEFGRDVSSQITREREKRYKCRAARQTCSTDPYHVKHDPILLSAWVEDNDAQNRYTILKEALRVALLDIEEIYTSIPALVDFFSLWKTEFPENFSQCYGNLSLGDLSSVLIKADFCQSDFTELMLRKDGEGKEADNLLSWKSHLKNTQTADQNQEGAVERVLTKIYVPFLVSLLHSVPTAAFLSARTSNLIASLADSTVLNLHPKSHSLATILEAVVQGIQNTLDSICIPMTKNVPLELGQHDPRVLHAMDFATQQQGDWIRTIIQNLIQDWATRFRGSRIYLKIGKSILEFIAGKYLLLLSSLDQLVATDLFLPVWNDLQGNHNQWLDSPTLMPECAPLRAAAVAYGLV